MLKAAYTKPPTATIGAAGVHLLAGYLSAMGLPVAVTQKNAPSIDLLVCSVHGEKMLPVQVKTMRAAQRWHRDGPKMKTRNHCEWRCSPGSLKKGLYAFVDLRLKREAKRPESLPDFYFVPVAVVRKWPRYKGGFYKPTEKQIGRYRNNWDFVRQSLALD